MAFTTIPAAWLDIGDPTKKELFDRIKDNQDDLDSRTSDTEAAVTNETPIIFQVNGKYWLFATSTLQGATGVTRIPFDIELTSSTLHVVDDGSAGTLTVDVLYKRGVAAWTTIFSVLPTITFGGGDNVITTGTISVTDLDAGDFLRMDITSVMTDNEFFNLFLTWEIRI